MPASGSRAIWAPAGRLAEAAESVGALGRVAAQAPGLLERAERIAQDFAEAAERGGLDGGNGRDETRRSLALSALWRLSKPLWRRFSKNPRYMIVSQGW
ncbi:MAG: hypothetical protein R3D43_11615 [Tepidamorphaceae bacterium]